MLWFIWANDTPVTVAFPFRLGHLDSTLGVVILLSAIVGLADDNSDHDSRVDRRKFRGPQSSSVAQKPNELAEDRPASRLRRQHDRGFSQDTPGHAEVSRRTRASASEDHEDRAPSFAPA